MAAAVKKSMKSVCLIVIDGWGISDETRGELSPAP
jgi:bisphosphoglycerate-independent phosphoglycerate mutase (AlkP superfamily)